MVSLLQPSSSAVQVLAAKLIAALVLVGISVATAQETTIVPLWDIPNNGSPSLPSMQATVGDTFVFNWEFGTHDVFIQDTDSCNFNDPASSLVYVGDATGAQYTFAEDDVGVKYFVCTIGNHCIEGMIMAVVISPYTSDEVALVPFWGFPQGGAPQLPPMASAIGETLRFTWNFGVHDVWLQNSPSCNDPGPWEFVGSISGVEYTFNATDADTTKYFVCYVGQHCQNGMVMEVDVSPFTEDEVTMVPYWGFPELGASSLEPMIATVGETLRFSWEAGATHDVWLQNSSSCDDPGPWEYVGAASGVEYTFNSTEVGTKHFVCYIGQHCQNGMVMEVTVLAQTDSPTANPTPPPTLKASPPKQPDTEDTSPALNTNNQVGSAAIVRTVSWWNMVVPALATGPLFLCQ